MQKGQVMPNPRVLIHGPNISTDATLVKRLGGAVEPLGGLPPRKLETALRERHNTTILLLEIEDAESFDLPILAMIRREFPEIYIILVDGSGDRKLLAKAFALGIKDAFPKPVKRDLLVERINILLRQS